ncbi:MAG TPA: ferritin-like domain-containing protein [Chloroflexota bacterium]|nr:ferritin-like domain-containing protein [Chloroflexota bacterium]
MSETMDTNVMTKLLSRRTFLVATSAAGAGVALASTVGISFAAPSASGDLATAMVAASLEVLAVGTYKAALAAAGAGKLGAVPPAVATFVQTAMSQHQFALDKWNGVITGAGSPAVSAPPSDLNATVQQAFGQVTDVVGAAKLALLLEQTAADTYMKAIPTLLSADAITLAGNLQIIDQQHSAVLLFVLGQYPVPDVFETGLKAYSPPGAPAPAPAAPAPRRAPVPAPVQDPS